MKERTREWQFIPEEGRSQALHVLSFDIRQVSSHYNRQPTYEIIIEICRQENLLNSSIKRGILQCGTGVDMERIEVNLVESKLLTPTSSLLHYSII